MFSGKFSTQNNISPPIEEEFIIKFKAAMKLITAFFITLLLFTACDSIDDETLQPESSAYRIKWVFAPDTLYFTEDDSTFAATLEVDNGELISKIWFDATLVDDGENILSGIEMSDDGSEENGDRTAGDNIFSGNADFSREFPVGDYEITWRIETISGQSSLAASHTMFYDNGKDNIAPVISNLVMQDIIYTDSTFVFSVDASDENGYEDIAGVWFELYRPNGTVVTDGRTGLPYFFMDDNGNMDVYGDETAGDGTFTFKNSFASTAVSGEWRFEFQAQDRRKFKSNKIIKNVTVQ